jgi:hypothetical protein
MRSVEEFVQKCDSCLRRKGDHEFTAPLGCVGKPTAPFEITLMDITGPYPVTARKNRYLLTFVDHFSKYAKIYSIPHQSAVTWANVYASQIITRHSSGSKLIADQGAAFISSFFNETCRIIVHRSRTSSYHPMSNGHVERMHRFTYGFVTLRESVPYRLEIKGSLFPHCLPFDAPLDHRVQSILPTSR